MNGQGLSPLPAPIVGRALLVSTDSTALRQLTDRLRQFAVSTDVCPDLATAASLINTRKFEAIVLDLALGDHVIPMFERIRLSTSNQNSVIFALVDSRGHPDFSIQPNFILEKPLSDGLIESTLKAALGLIIRDYRRYFRCPIAVPVVIQIDGMVQVPCETLNISEGGLAIKTLVTFKPGAPVRAQFVLPDEIAAFDVNAEICWCDNKGRAGLHFRSIASEQMLLLQGWLSHRIEQGLPEPAARFFHKAQ